MDIGIIIAIAIGGLLGLGFLIWLIAYPIHRLCAKIKNVKSNKYQKDLRIQELEAIVYKDTKKDLEEFVKQHDIPINKLQEFLEEIKEKK